MLKDPMLEWTKRFIVDWVLINSKSFIKFLNKIPLTFVQKQVLLLYFVPDTSGNTKEFKEIEHLLKYSHSNIMIIYRDALKIVLDNLGASIY